MALNALIEIGPTVLLLAVVLAVAYAALGRIPRDSAGRLEIGRSLLGSCLVGAAAFIVGAVLGIAIFCSPADAGNLCGLGGLFGTGPLLAGLAIAIHAHRRARRSARP